MNSDTRSKLIALAVTLLFCLLSALSNPEGSRALAQGVAAPPAPPQPVPQMAPMAPDRKAYTDAARIADPQKKIEALEKFIADFPRSSMIGPAHQSIASALIKNTPDQTARIVKHASLAIESANEFMQRSLLNQLATEMAEAGVLLDKAEEFANRALAMAEEEQMKALRLSRASHQSLMGRIHLKKGKIRDAEKAFNAAYNAVPIADASPTTLRAAALGLAEIYEKSGNYDKALEYLTTAALFGRADIKVRQRLETAYRKTHNDSTKGLTETLDAKYEKLYPHPIKAEPYQPTKARANRTALAEVFTGAGCGPCVAADLAFDAYLERYSRKDLIVVMYHLHIPLPDPMTNPSTQARASYYTVRGVPSFSIDGDSSQSGGGPRSMTRDVYNRLLPMIEKQLETESGAEIQLNATTNGSVITVTANVTNLKKGIENPRLQIALVEEKLRYSGENGVRFHPMVVRSMAGEGGKGIVLDAAKPGPVEWRFDIAAITEANKKHLDTYEEGRKTDNFTFSEKMSAIDPAKLSVVVFAQDDKTRRVLQSAIVKINSSQAASNR